jgi:hypothetical protein
MLGPDVCLGPSEVILEFDRVYVRWRPNVRLRYGFNLAFYNKTKNVVLIRMSNLEISYSQWTFQQN